MIHMEQHLFLMLFR